MENDRLGKVHATTSKKQVNLFNSEVFYWYADGIEIWTRKKRRKTKLLGDQETIEWE